MPVYVYQELGPDGEEGDCFEVEQPMGAPALKVHPESGQAVRRVYLPPHLGLKHTQGHTQRLLDNRRVEAAGFTKYVRDGLTGRYHRVAGQAGPGVIERGGA